MSNDQDLREYRQLQVDLLASKFKGSHTEAELVERLASLCQRKNKYATRALKRAKLWLAPNPIKANSFYGSAANLESSNVATPRQTGPAGTDNFGLWRDYDKRG